MSYLPLVLALWAAQRLRCASAIRLRASALSTRFFGDFLAGDLLACRPLTPVEGLPVLLSNLRTSVSLAISESIWARIESIAMGQA